MVGKRDTYFYNIVDAYNKKEVQIAKTEHRNAELLPKVSARIIDVYKRQAVVGGASGKHQCWCV